MFCTCTWHSFSTQLQDHTPQQSILRACQHSAALKLQNQQLHNCRNKNCLIDDVAQRNNKLLYLWKRQNIQLARLPLGLSCNYVWPGSGHLTWLILYPAFSSQAVFSLLGQYVECERRVADAGGPLLTPEPWSIFSRSLCLQSLYK
jgi:hypothetical protein